MSASRITCALYFWRRKNPLQIQITCGSTRIIQWWHTAVFEIIQKRSDNVTKKKKDVKLQDMFEYSERQDKNCPLAQNEHVRVVRYKYRYALMTLCKSFWNSRFSHCPQYTSFTLKILHTVTIISYFCLVLQTFQSCQPSQCGLCNILRGTWIGFHPQTHKLEQYLMVPALHIGSSLQSLKRFL